MQAGSAGSSPSRLSTLVPVAAGLVLAALPWFVSPYQQDLIAKILVYALFALSLELLVGTTGLVSLGHAAFFGIGALSLRTRGVYFIMVTLAFAQMAYFVFHDTKLGGGTDGIFMYVRPVLGAGGAVWLDLEDKRHFYYLALGALALTYALLALLLRSRFGHALVGIRLNEQRMRAAGFSTYGYKLAGFVIAGALAGLAGFLVAVKDAAVNPELLSWHESGAVLLMIILGGLGHLRGAFIGALAFTLLKEFFQSESLLGPLASHWQLTLGFTIIGFVAWLPKGLSGIALPRLTRRTAPTDPAKAAAAEVRPHG